MQCTRAQHKVSLISLIWVPSPLMGEGQGGGGNCREAQSLHPHPNLPPSRGKEFVYRIYGTTSLIRRHRLFRRAARQPWHLETVRNARIAALAGETSDRIHAADIDVIAVVDEAVVVMEPHDFADHQMVGPAAELDDLHKLAFHRDRRLLDARRPHHFRRHGGEAGLLELVDAARIVDRADVHLVLDGVAYDVHDKFGTL